MFYFTVGHCLQSRCHLRRLPFLSRRGTHIAKRGRSLKTGTRSKFELTTQYNDVGPSMIVFICFEEATNQSRSLHALRETITWILRSFTIAYIWSDTCCFQSRCHSGFVPLCQSSGRTNLLVDTFHRKEYASVCILPRTSMRPRKCSSQHKCSAWNAYYTSQFDPFIINGAYNYYKHGYDDSNTS